METDFFEEQELSEVTLQSLNLLGEAIFKQNQKVDEVEAVAKKENALLEKMKAKMINILETHGHTNYQVPGLGKLQMRERTSVTLPKTPQDKDAFYTYLKEKGLFEHLITVNSQTLNAFWKKEREVAISEGRSAGFKIPGIDEPKTMALLAITKG